MKQPILIQTPIFQKKKPTNSHSTLISVKMKFNMITSDFTQVSVVSPINKNKKSNSNRDYQEQQERAKNNQQIMWDDAKNNPTKQSGGFFGFVHNGKRVEIHMITHICEPCNRLESWSKNVGQSNRNVLLLTPCLLTISWHSWLSLNCPMRVQGTSR